LAPERSEHSPPGWGDEYPPGGPRPKARTFSATQPDAEEHDDKVGFRFIPDYPADELVEVSATGAACFVVHRTVLEKIRANYGDRWFDRVDHPRGTRFSEDLSFS
jgi:hypothetical protein